MEMTDASYSEIRAWICQELTVLGAEDPSTLADYVYSIVESSDVDQAGQVVETYVSDSSAVSRFTKQLGDMWHDKKITEAQDVPTAVSITGELKSKWSQQQPQQSERSEACNAEEVSRANGNRIDDEDRALTLRLAQQIQEMRFQEQVEEELGQKEEEGESIAQKNRAMVQAKLAQAQKAREVSVQKHKAESKAAATSDRKDKAQRKEDRQQKAQKGERRRG